MRHRRLKDAFIIILIFMLLETVISGFLQSTYEAVRSAAGYTAYQYFGRALGMGLAVLVTKIAFGYYVLIFIGVYYMRIGLESYSVYKMTIIVASAFVVSITLLLTITSDSYESGELLANLMNPKKYIELIIIVLPSIATPFIVSWLL